MQRPCIRSTRMCVRSIKLLTRRSWGGALFPPVPSPQGMPPYELRVLVAYLYMMDVEKDGLVGGWRFGGDDVCV